MSLYEKVLRRTLGKNGYRKLLLSSNLGNVALGMLDKWTADGYALEAAFLISPQ